MSRKIISLLLVVCMLIPFGLTAYAAEADANSLEIEVADRIEQMVFAAYSDSPGQYRVNDPITIYNADIECMYYILPVFCGQNCVGTVEVDTTGNVSLTENVVLYTNISELTSSEYLLYTSGGVVYAEVSGNVFELYDSGFYISLSNDFTDLPYTEKVATVDTCLENTPSNFDINTVAETVDLVYIIDSNISLFAEVPSVEAKNCAISKFITQGNYKICWAACVATIVNFKNGRNLSAENVASALGHNYTSSSYTGASVSQTVSALSYYGLSYSNTNAKLSWTRVKSNINANSPFIMGITSSAGGHMLTGYGYGCQYGDDDADASMRYVQVWDPNGYKRTLQYYASSYSLYGYSWRWTETLVG